MLPKRPTDRDVRSLLAYMREHCLGRDPRPPEWQLAELALGSARAYAENRWALLAWYLFSAMVIAEHHELLRSPHIDEECGRSWEKQRQELQRRYKKAARGRDTARVQPYTTRAPATRQESSGKP